MLGRAPEARRGSVTDVEKVDIEPIMRCSRSTSRRVELPYSSFLSAAFMRGSLSVSRRRER